MPDARPLAEPYRLRCLGPVSFTAPDGCVRRFRTRKQMALVLLLALRAGRAHGREQLVELLWTEDEERAARHSLAQSISLINKLFGFDAIELAGKDQVRLREGLVWVDVEAFAEAAQQGRHADARALWRGNLLEGLWVRAASGFEAWLEGERQRLVRLHREVLHQAVEAERAAGDWAAMRATAEALLASDPLDETAMLAFLEALALGGDRTLALRTYKEFEARLDAELGAAPGPALKCWIKRQRIGDQPAPSVPPRVAETLTLPTPRPVFGREEEFAFLWDGWLAAQRNDGRFIILEGVAGIGKSALATKLANQVHVSGGSVCFARCWRTEKSVPFAPITAILRQLMRLPGFVGLNEVWISELSRLVPELRERYPTVPAPMAIDDSARHRICDATLQAADCVAYESPLLIVVDDIQNADEATLALLHYFGRQTADKPTMLLCVARSGSAESELEKTFFETARATRIARFLELRSLPMLQASKIIRQVLAERGLDLPEWAIERLYERSSGNPLNLIESAMALPPRDGQEQALWVKLLVTHLRTEQETFEQSSAERLRQLEPVARHVAAVLAVAGRPLSDYELASVAGHPTTELALAVSALESASFVRRTGGQLSFMHERYQNAALDALDTSTLKSIHLALARLLERSAAENHAARQEVADHYERGGDLTQARTQALLAAEYAGSIGAIKGRAAALALAHRSGACDWETSADLAHCLLDLRETGAASQLVSEHKRCALPSKAQGEFDFLEISTEYNEGSLSLSNTRDRLIELLRRHQAFPARNRAQLMLLRSADKSGEPLLARRVARAWRKELINCPSASAQGYALALSGFVAIKYYWPAYGLSRLQEAVKRAQSLRDWQLEQWCRQGLGAALLQLGRYDESIAHIEYGIALARKVLDPFAEAEMLSDMSCTAIAQGNLQAAACSLFAARELWDRYPQWPMSVYLVLNTADLLLVQGQSEQAASRYEEAYQLASRQDIWLTRLIATAGRALCAARLDDRATLREWAGNLESLLSVHRQDAVHDRAIIEAAHAWHVHLDGGRHSAALARMERAARELSRRNVDHWLRLELEIVLLKEHATNRRDEHGRTRVRTIAESFGAEGIAAAAN